MNGLTVVILSMMAGQIGSSPHPDVPVINYDGKLPTYEIVIYCSWSTEIIVFYVYLL